MKTTKAAAVLVVLALWLGYYLGHRNGLQEERRAWLATAQTATLLPPSVAPDARILQTPRISAPRTFYSNPHSGTTLILKWARSLNVPDPRDTPTK